MIFHHTGSKDTYITNKIIDGVSRATGANVGYASTIDMFKLHNESQLKGTTGSDIQEISRGLLYFDLDQLNTALTPFVDLNNASLKIALVLTDVQGSQVAPANFTLELYQVQYAWDEGIGDNIISFGDLHATNWLSRSLGTLWDTAGGDTVNYGSDNYIASQTFTTGLEDLEMDVTAWVKAHWGDAATYPNNGWLLKFTSTEETNSKSYFVKRFASRHTKNPFSRPKLVASWENYHIDDRLAFAANTSNTLTIRNFSKGTPTNFLTGSTPTLTVVSGSTTLKSGIASSAVSLAGKAQDGMYACALNIDVLNDSDYTSIATDLFASGSLLLQERWYDGTFLVHSGSFTLNNPQSDSSGAPKDYRFSIIDLQSVYTSQDVPVIRLFVRDRNRANEPVRIPIELQSQIINKVYYQIRDTNSLKILIPFSDKLPTPNESTRVSADSQGMYFSFPVSVLPRGRTYTIDIAFYDRGKRRIYQSNQAFRVNK